MVTFYSRGLIESSEDISVICRSEIKILLCGKSLQFNVIITIHNYSQNIQNFKLK